MSASQPESSQPPADEGALNVPLSETSAQLAWATPPVAPPARVKQALLERIRAAQPAALASGPNSKTTTEGWHFSALAGGEGWIPLPFPGVRMREVTTDRERDTALLYVEMAPGAIFPSHGHAATERGVVLSGDFETDGRLLHAGDFYEASAGTEHVRISSPSGCTGLLWVSLASWLQWRAAMTR